MNDWQVRFEGYDLVDPNTLAEHSHNTNFHPQDQIESLAKILEYQGWRKAIVVSKETDMITSGHARKLAAIRGGQKFVPVVYQSYDSLDQEIADVTADNAIALRAELDLGKLNGFVGELGPDFDLGLLGLKDFGLNAESQIGRGEEGQENKFMLVINCQNESQMKNLYERLITEGHECKIIA